jgi:hypothetical protein
MIGSLDFNETHIWRVEHTLSPCMKIFIHFGDSLKREITSILNVKNRDFMYNPAIPLNQADIG